MSACSGLLDKVLALSIARFAKQTSEAWRLLSKTKNTIFSRTAYTAGLGVSMSQRTLPSISARADCPWWALVLSGPEHEAYMRMRNQWKKLISVFVQEDSFGSGQSPADALDCMVQG